MYLLKRVIAFVMEILETLTFIGSIFIVIYLFIMQPNQVKGTSMVPTFQDKDYILTSKISFKFRTPQKGDVVVFKSPEQNDVEFIKRVIGVPGDQVVIQDQEIYVNNVHLNEQYISDKTNLWEGGFIQNGVPVIVPPNHIFVMGDNRPRSLDSRQFGFIPNESIIGLVFYRYFPPNKIGFIANPLKEQFKASGGSGAPTSVYYYLARP